MSLDRRNVNVGEVVVRLAAIVSLASCSASPPSVRTFDQGQRDQLAVPDRALDCSERAPLTAPALAAHDAVTDATTFPIRGTAAGASYVIASSGGNTGSPVAVGADGSFCTEVPLVIGQNNAITITPFDQVSCPGAPALTQIRQQNSGRHDAGASSQVINVVMGKTVSSDTTPTSSYGAADLQSLVDDDPESWFRIELWDPEVGASCTSFTWLRVELTKSFIISRFTLRWATQAATENTYATCYALLLSNAQTPPDPDAANPDWITAYQTEQGDSGTQDINLTPQRARWIALMLGENARTDWNGYEAFDVAELEVFGQDPDGTPPPPPPTCQ